MRAGLLVVLSSFVSALACGSSPPAAANAACPDVAAIVATSDYTSSGVGSLGLGGPATLQINADFGKDPVLSVSRGRAFYVGRLEGTVFELDACGKPTSKILVNDPVRPGTTNPQDVAVAPDGTLWIPRYNDATVAIVKDGRVAETIDLTSYDVDDNPQATAIQIVDVQGAPKAFVALERLDTNLKPTQPAAMLRIDVATRKVEAAIPLVGRNPSLGAMTLADGVLYVASAGDIFTTNEKDAGIERFDPATSTTRLLVSEAKLGWSALELAVSGKCGVAIVAGPEANVNPTSLVTFDTASGNVLQRDVLGPSATFDTGLRGVTWVSDGKVLLVGDRLGDAGKYAIHAFDRTGDCTLAKRADTMFVSQPPISVRPAP